MAIYIHQFDPTAQSPQNLVPNEEHNLSGATALTIVAKTGLFYTDSLVVQNASTNVFYYKGIDFTFEGFDPIISALGHECAAGITFKTLSTGSVYITYQAVGGLQGERSALVSQLRDTVASLQVQNVTWSQVLNKPEFYPPEPTNINILTQLTGLNALTNVLNKIYNSLTNNRVLTNSAADLSSRIDRLVNLIGIQNNTINKLSVNSVNPSVSQNIVTNTSGVVNISVGANTTRYIFSASSNISSLTINLTNTPVDKCVLELAFTNTINALTLTNITLPTIISGNAISSNSSGRWVYSLNLNKWVSLS